MAKRSVAKTFETLLYQYAEFDTQVTKLYSSFYKYIEKLILPGLTTLGLGDHQHYSCRNFWNKNSTLIVSNRCYRSG